MIYTFLDKMNIDLYFNNKMSQLETVSDIYFNPRYIGWIEERIDLPFFIHGFQPKAILSHREHLTVPWRCFWLLQLG